jgi:hypothetical protein
MILLDENIRLDQGEQLRRWRIRFRFLAQDIAHHGIKDQEITPLLHRLKNPTLFTHDQDFFRRDLAHPGYCLVWLDVFDGQAARFIRAFLKQPDFNTAARRMGAVVRVHQAGIDAWRRNKDKLQKRSWDEA